MTRSKLNAAVNYSFSHPSNPIEPVAKYNLMWKESNCIKTWLTNEQCKQANAAASLNYS